jgi:NADPH2:quinone reductase
VAGIYLVEGTNSITYPRERTAMSVPATMRALQQTSLDGPQDMRLITDAPVPIPGRGEVLVRVAAAGINFADIAKAHGTFLDGPRPPYVAGFEAAGEVVAVGEAVTGTRPGSRVIGVGNGAFAEYMVLPAAAAVPLPAGWTEQETLGLVVNWPTALAALKPLGGITAGQNVLIHAAAGATGQAAVRMAKHYGATVIATASPGKHETVLALGADHVLDSRGHDLAAEVLRLTGGTGADVVLESAGGTTFEASLAAARRVTGRIVVSGLPGGEAAITNWELVYRHQVHIIGLNIGVLIRAAPRIFGELMAELSALVARGVLTPGLPTTYDLADGPKALAELESRATVGKLALLFA